VLLLNTSNPDSGAAEFSFHCTGGARFGDNARPPMGAWLGRERTLEFRQTASIPRSAIWPSGSHVSRIEQTREKGALSYHTFLRYGFMEPPAAQYTRHRSSMGLNERSRAFKCRSLFGISFCGPDWLRNQLQGPVGLNIQNDPRQGKSAPPGPRRSWDAWLLGHFGHGGRGQQECRPCRGT